MCHWRSLPVGFQDSRPGGGPLRSACDGQGKPRGFSIYSDIHVSIIIIACKKPQNFAFLADRFNSMFRPFESGCVPLRVFVFDVVNTLLIGDGVLT